MLYSHSTSGLEQVTGEPSASGISSRKERVTKIVSSFNSLIVAEVTKIYVWIATMSKRNIIATLDRQVKDKE